MNHWYNFVWITKVWLYLYTRVDPKVRGPMYFGHPVNQNLTTVLKFNLFHEYCNMLLISGAKLTLLNTRFYKWPQTTHFWSLWHHIRPYSWHHEDGIHIMEPPNSKGESYHKNMVNEEEFLSRRQSIETCNMQHVRRLTVHQGCHTSWK